MSPNYVVRKSILPSLSIWLILFFWLIIPLIIQIIRILDAKNYSIEFYDDRIVEKWGILGKYEDQSIFMGVYAVSVSQTFMGRIFGYGDIYVDCPGKWDIDTEDIADPFALKRYLETRIAKAGTTNVIHN